MNSYIDADWIYRMVENRYRVSSGIEHRCERDLLDLICSAPTADVVEVRHGEWYSLMLHSYMCSLCEHEVNIGEDYYSEDYDAVEDWGLNFCPNCGAKMDGERREG